MAGYKSLFGKRLIYCMIRCVLQNQTEFLKMDKYIYLPTNTAFKRANIVVHRLFMHFQMRRLRKFLDSIHHNHFE